MTPADRAAAQRALDEGRGVYGRLDQIRGPEDAAADILDLWGAAEAAMRAMLGGSTLSGQALVRELRQRGILNLEQANALATFWDARSRVEDVGYKPTLTDVGYARMGYNELSRAITEAPSGSSAPTAGTAAADASPFAPPAARAAAGATGANAAATGAAAAGAAAGTASAPRAAAAAPPPPAASGAAAAPVVRRRRSPAGLVIGLVVLVLILAIGAYFAFGRSSYDREMASAIDLMQSSRTEAARAAFSKIASEHPDQAEPHVFLARLARTDGDANTARQELATAIRLEPGNSQAQREMGLLLLSQNDAELARRFLVRAVQLDTTDHAAQGYLGCALLRLGRVEEGQRFISRAGSGSWSTCTAVPAAPTTAATAPPR